MELNGESSVRGGDEKHPLLIWGFMIEFYSRETVYGPPSERVEVSEKEGLRGSSLSIIFILMILQISTT